MLIVWFHVWCTLSRNTHDGLTHGLTLLLYRVISLKLQNAKRAPRKYEVICKYVKLVFELATLRLLPFQCDSPARNSFICHVQTHRKELTNLRNNLFSTKRLLDYIIHPSLENF